MLKINLNQFLTEVHQNAKEHGWWDEERSDGTVRALFHAELSEALEEYRAKRPMMWFDGEKPEGIAVELIDCVIRIMDYMGKEEIELLFEEPEQIAKEATNAYEYDEGAEKVENLELPDFVDELHTLIAQLAFDPDPVYYDTIIGLVFAWIERHDLDPVEIMLRKHVYNKTRPYKHGGKVC